MTRPLAGLRVVEIAMWAFVPSAGGILADMGADVIKLEPPAGDPIRHLVTGGAAQGAGGFTTSWEIYNRGKSSVTLDLAKEGALDVLHRLLDTADVFLTSLLPPARRKLGIDVDSVRQRHPNLIYAVGSALGPRGDQSETGGFDAITFWARGGVSAGVTPSDAAYPLGMPSGAFGDCISGAILAGAIAAAVAQRAMTGKVSTVDASLLNSSLWAMQSKITQLTAAGIDEYPRSGRSVMPNPLVNVYRTADDRYVSLCMLQSERYWGGFCDAIGRPDIKDDPRFVTADVRGANVVPAMEILDEVFASKPLAEWKRILATQGGHWDVVQKAGELKDDPQVIANEYMQPVDYSDGRTLKMVSAPMQFDRTVLTAHPAPELGADNDAVLGSLGYSEDQIIDLKVAEIIY